MMTHLILYVRDQAESTDFYSALLKKSPVLNVPGMTEFRLGEVCVLGLMPETGIKKLLGARLPDPAQAQGIPRAELYLIVDDCQAYCDRAMQLGAAVLSASSVRDWGHTVSYCLDQDGHVLAFAEITGKVAS